MSAWIDIMSEFARAKRGMPSDWRWFHAESIGNDSILLTGCSTPAPYVRGKRKGEPNWSKRDKDKDTKVVFSRSELHAFESEWEQLNQKCVRCFGTGEVTKSHSIETGRVTKTCPACNGSGKPREVEP